jgi:hypothetical protein
MLEDPPITVECRTLISFSGRSKWGAKYENDFRTLNTVSAVLSATPSQRRQCAARESHMARFPKCPSGGFGELKLRKKMLFKKHLLVNRISMDLNFFLFQISRRLAQVLVDEKYST